MSSTHADDATLPPEHPQDEVVFSTFLTRHDRTLVYFHAEWCRQCERMNEHVADVAETTGANVLWVDVEKHPAIAARYDVSAVPTLIAFDGGEPTGRLVGRQDRSTIEGIASR